MGDCWSVVVICGYHFQSDVDAARIVASAVVARLHANDAFVCTETKFSTFPGSMLQVSHSGSQNTGLSPARMTANMEAM